MCIVFAAYQCHPNYKLIIAANRDEFYKRPTKDAHFWDDEPNLLAGRDLEQMGTWMGISKKGRFAALTNFRNPKDMDPNRKSRGHIVRNFLASEDSPKNFLNELQKERKQYQGFNILLGDTQSFYYYSNVENKIKQLQPGIYGLSNHLLDTPWPKVEKGKKQLETLISTRRSIEDEDLFRLLSDAEPAPKDQLPATGVASDLEEKLSSIFIKTPEYGTRCSTILTISHHDEVNFIERTFPSNKKDRHFHFYIER